MPRFPAAALALAMSAIPLVPFSAYAHHQDGPIPHSYDPNSATPAEAYANCMAYSPKLRTSVWVCGAPYPPGIPALNSRAGGTETYSNCTAYSRKLHSSVWVCGPPYPPGMPVFSLKTGIQ